MGTTGLRRRRRSTAVVAAVAGVITGLLPWAARADTAPPPSDCVRHQTLVLSAMPLELNPLVSRLTDAPPAVRVGDRTFYPGRLAGNDVVLAMTGIGLVNAAETTTTAFDHFGACSFNAVIFSGVAGSIYNIGDVAIPQTWTQDGGASFVDADPKMLDVAQTIVGHVALARDVPVGDAACLCPGVDHATPVHMPQEMKLVVGGRGTSADTFGGHAVPCLPGGGDIAGCKPCLLTSPGLTDDAVAFAKNAPPLFDQKFVQGMVAPPDQTTDAYASQDEETASMAHAAVAAGVPFLGVRAVSDGHGDPLGLPGFPFQFFVYRQLAGNNAAAVTVAFLQAWAAAGHPTAPSALTP